MSRIEGFFFTIIGLAKKKKTNGKEKQENHHNHCYIVIVVQLHNLPVNNNTNATINSTPTMPLGKYPYWW